MDSTNPSVSSIAAGAETAHPDASTNNDVRTRVLRKGDLVRIRKIRETRLKNYDGALGKIVRSIAIPPEEIDETHFDLWERHALLYDLEFVLGGKIAKIHRREMLYTTAEAEGMVSDGGSARGKRKRKPSTVVLEAAAEAEHTKKKGGAKKKAATGAANGNKKNGKAAPKSAAKKAVKKAAGGKRKGTSSSSKIDSNKKAKQVVVASAPLVDDIVISKDIYEKHRKDFERSLIRLEKVDHFGFFFEEVTEKMTTALAVNAQTIHAALKSESNDSTTSLQPVASANTVQSSAIASLPQAQSSPQTVEHSGTTLDDGQNQIDYVPPSSVPSQLPNGVSPLPTPVSSAIMEPPVVVDPFAKPPRSWYDIRQRRDAGRYAIDRLEKLERERKRRLGPYIWDRRKKKKQIEKEGAKNIETWELHEISAKVPSKPNAGKRSLKRNGVRMHPRVLHPTGVDWNLFRSDVLAMCDAAAARDPRGVEGGPGTPGHAARKTKELLDQIFQRTAKKHMNEMEFADARHEFTVLLEAKSNAAAAMQGAWQTTPFDERKYERLRADAVCDGLSSLDELTASHEKQTSLPDSFVGLAYSHNDTGESEGWMKSVFESAKTKSQKDVLTEEQKAANALANDDGVVRAQVRATMRTLLIGVQDRVLTDAGVLKNSELHSANWDPPTAVAVPLVSSTIAVGSTTPVVPDLVEQSVWGMDCYTRLNILICTEKDLDPETAVEFLEKWLLPAINACPIELAHDLTNAAKILEGLPLQSSDDEEEVEKRLTGQSPPQVVSKGLKPKKSRGPKKDPNEMWSHSLIGKALAHKMKYSGPPWLAAAAYQLRRAIKSLGQDFFRVHPKGHGSIVLSPMVKANSLVTFYRGEVYPSWRWGEKLDAIEMTQQHLSLRPNLPDFYNMALERPQSDPRGYGLMIVDASRKAGHGSMLSHSCDPTCEVRVAALNGQLCLAMTTLRDIEQGEELTFDYNAVTESVEEYSSAICLCGYNKCRGSFLHFATADCYQQVLNRNSPIAARFANLVKGCTKKVMSDEDEQTLGTHGFGTAAFGAVSFNRNLDANSTYKGPLDSTDNIPVWLRTYVADVLRYVEYERRALPIALLCDHFKADKAAEETASKEKAVPKSAKKDKKSKNIEEEKAKGDVSQVIEAQTKGSVKSEEGEEKKTKKSKTASKDPESLNLSKISFEAADAEGVSAMEQRIQQLTQALSRIGRVLNRHREKDFVAQPGSKLKGDIHAPLSIMTDHEVVSWMWCNDRGVAISLLRSIKTEKCADPSLYKALVAVKMKYEMLDTFVLNPSVSGISNIEARKILTSALIGFRNCLNDGVQELAKQYKSHELRRNRAKAQTRRDDVKLAAKNEVKLVLLDIIDQVILRAQDSEATSDRTSMDVNSGDLAPVVEEKQTAPEVEKNPWLEHYQDRWKLEAAADIMLLHARTSTFFKIVPYMQLQSTPLEVYARELGNKIPRSKIKRMQDSTIGEPSNIVLLEESAEENLCDTSATSGANDKTTDSKHLKSEKKRQTSALCDPDETVANVTVKYTGDYVMSQLLQWFNGGVGQKQGLPDMVGCVVLPSVEATLLSSATFSGRARKTTTVYRHQLRPRLFDWLRDPHQRGSTFPDELARVFKSPELVYKGEQLDVLPLGSPILDFLVMGEDANINLVLAALDEDRLRDLSADASKDSATNRLESTVDEGMPAQAVAKWVQCENEKCLKWRRLPFFVDLDILPEQFFCRENIWNPAAQSCDVLEDTWDQNDTNVQNDGVAKESDKQMLIFEKEKKSGLKELSKYEIGSRFDIMRTGKNYYCTGEVVDVDLKGDIKKVKLHFPKTPEKFDEWIEISSPKIAPLKSKQVSKKERKKATSDATNAKKTNVELKQAPKVVKAAPKLKEKAVVVKNVPDPSFVAASLLALRCSNSSEEQGELKSAPKKLPAKKSLTSALPKAIPVSKNGHRTIDALEDTDSDEDRPGSKPNKVKKARLIHPHGEMPLKSRKTTKGTMGCGSSKKKAIGFKKPKAESPLTKKERPHVPGAIPRKPKAADSALKLKALINASFTSPPSIPRKLSSVSSSSELRIPRKSSVMEPPIKKKHSPSDQIHSRENHHPVVPRKHQMSAIPPPTKSAPQKALALSVPLPIKVVPRKHDLTTRLLDTKTSPSIIRFDLVPPSSSKTQIHRARDNNKQGLLGGRFVPKK